SFWGEKSMSDETRRHEMTTRQLVYSIPGAEELPVRREVEYAAGDGGPLAFDLYLPRGAAAGAPAPVVGFVNGDPARGRQRAMGGRLKEMQCYVSWARLAAASGMAAVLYTTREPVADAAAVLRHLRQQAAALAIDAGRLGLWACSGHGPLALSLLLDQ